MSAQTAPRALIDKCVGVQSAIPHPEAGRLLRKLMTEQGLPAPPVGRTLESICITAACE